MEGVTGVVFLSEASRVLDVGKLMSKSVNNNQRNFKGPFY